MTGYVDIHCHMLSGVDDGAKNDEEMYQMLDAAYSSGTRAICLTPHFNPTYYGMNKEASFEAFERLSRYAAEKYPDMVLRLGNELNYFFGADEYIVSNECRTLDGGRNVLVDFQFDISFFELKNALYRLKSTGLVPIFAHAERYDCIKPPYSSIKELKEAGIYIQLNANSITGAWGRKEQKKALKIIKLGLADAVASDAHNLGDRAPELCGAEKVIVDRFDANTADYLLRRGPREILGI